MTHFSSPTQPSDTTEHTVPPAKPLYWLALAALALSVATVITMTAYSRHMERWVEHSTRMYQTTRSGLLDVTGPLSRGDSASMSSFHVDAARAIARFDTVADSTRDNPVQLGRMRVIRELAGQWSSALRDRPAAAPGLATAVQTKVDEFLADEQLLRAIRLTQFHRAQAATAMTVTVELAFVAVILVAYSRRIAKATALAATQQSRLEEQAAELQEQTLELEISNHELRESVRRAEQETEKATGYGLEQIRIRALLDTALESAPVAFALVDNDLHFLQVNSRWAKLTGGDRVDHLGRRFDELPFSHDALAEAIELIAAARDTSTPAINVQLSGHGVADAEGGRRQWLISAVPLVPGSQFVGGLAVALLDVSDYTRAVHQQMRAETLTGVKPTAA